MDVAVFEDYATASHTLGVKERRKKLWLSKQTRIR
jgi:hypothetical protein